MGFIGIIMGYYWSCKQIWKAFYLFQLIRKLCAGEGGGLGLWKPCLLSWSQECEDVYAEFYEVESPTPTLSTVLCGEVGGRC